MAKIYLSYSRKELEFAKLLVEKLKANGHEIVFDDDSLTPGGNWRSILDEGLRNSDAFIILLSQNSLASQNALMEVGSARAYSAETGKPLVIPIAIDDIPIPLALQDIQFLFAQDRDVEQIAQGVERALSHHHGLLLARETKAQEAARKIEANAPSYIEDAIKAQQAVQTRNSRAGRLWYGVGFASLLIGIAFAFYSFSMQATAPDWIGLARLVVTNVIIVGFLGACSRYAFSLGKSYISESLKASDRIHAIAFGRFYLNAFGDKATWTELKEVFANWNIDRTSAFAGLDVSQIDPQIISLIGQLAASARKS